MAKSSRELRIRRGSMGSLMFDIDDVTCSINTGGWFMFGDIILDPDEFLLFKQLLVAADNMKEKSNV